MVRGAFRGKVADAAPILARPSLPTDSRKPAGLIHFQLPALMMICR
jgi:hypothetical protein